MKPSPAQPPASSPPWGRVSAHPGAGNVIPGCATALLDLRHADDLTRAAALHTILQSAHQAAAARRVHLNHTLLLEQPAVPLDAALTAHLTSAAQAAGHSAPTLTSGAGHDAMIVAPHLPAAMLSSAARLASATTPTSPSSPKT